MTCPDTRSTNPAPSTFTATTTGLSADFKSGSAIGLTTAGYSGVISFRPYASGSDWSGGNAHQIACNNAGVYWRQGGSSWGAWQKFTTSAVSTIKAKTNIKEMEENEALKILQLNPISFDYKEGFGEKNQFGLLVEEVEPILPYVVFSPSEEEEFKSLEYEKFAPYFIKMFQVQQKEINELKQ